MSITDALNIFRFSFFKLCEEVELKPEYIEIIEKEPVDVVIKYIDLSDKDLKREGIIQIKKDEDNEELKYSVRSIFLNIIFPKFFQPEKMNLNLDKIFLIKYETYKYGN